MESLIQQIEEQIREDYNFLRYVPWCDYNDQTVTPDRNSASFIDMVMARLVIRYGFADGMRLAFEVSEYLKGLAKQ